MAQDEALMYYQSALQPINANTPIGEALMDGDTYYYFTALSDGITSDEYWHHLADMPLPSSFQLLIYNFDGFELSEEQFINLNQSYPEGASPFLINVRERDYFKQTFDFNEHKGGFTINEMPRAGNQYAWDYKRQDESNPKAMFSCGTKCRETVVLGGEQFQLLVFHSQENMTEDKAYYVPCLGKMACGVKETTDIVYFNTNRKDLIEYWLKRVHGNSYGERPGIADHIENPRHKTFGAGNSRVTISYTDDLSELYIRTTCKPLYKLCP